jgi:mitochondrial fission protein ELM1
MNKNKRCWVVTDGKAGMENQALGLAEALGMDISIKRIVLRSPWRQLSPYLRCGLKHSFSPKGDLLLPPWPDLVIATGRPSILPALYTKKMSQNKTKVVYIQNPKISPAHMDVVIAPKHDYLTGKNVIQTNGAMHRITEKVLEQGQEKFRHFSTFPSPRLGVLFGGSNGSYELKASTMLTLMTRLKALQEKYQGSLLISPSRRTDEESLKILDQFKNQKNVYIWDGKDDNPYFGLLAWADSLFVTCDSVSMISEVCSTDKSVYLLRLPGHNKKFDAFHKTMIELGRLQWFEGEEEIIFSRVPSLNEMPRVVDQVQRLLLL